MDIKELEERRDELNKQIKEYYNSKTFSKLEELRKAYVGKCFKYQGDDNETIYVKYLSELSTSPGNQMSCMITSLPFSPVFKHVFKLNYAKYEYSFSDRGDICPVEFDECGIPGGFKYKDMIEISEAEFHDAVRKATEQAIEYSKNDFTMNGEYFKK